MKKILFLSGTRADFGKLKSLIKIVQNSDEFESHVFVTGMHMNSLYGKTVDEIYKSKIENITTFINYDKDEFMDITLANTIVGFSEYIKSLNPDLIVVHGDRVEALAGAISGSINNYLVAHIEGGEVSGTIDELIRHSVSKMSHIHLVANNEAKNRLIQLGEYDDSIFIIGSPDLDLMDPSRLPNIDFVKEYYDIDFKKFSLAMFHPVTTEFNNISNYAKTFCETLIESGDRHILIYPNNDLGSKEILNEIKKIENHENIKVFPSLRFEYFLTLLKNSEYIIGNSSAGIREAPFYNVPTIDIGTRQNSRASLQSIINCSYDKHDILSSISELKQNSFKKNQQKDKVYFGKGRSDMMFLKLIKSDKLWKINIQKQFQEYIK